ncbi:hypothetical protein [Brucella anthropi]|uniref:hypothetical protein n=1 Tax=Brucella anthropi TaxID=529 RepID=UPI000F66D6C6|nr:hypothetical protein [Brucella anthropi]RRY03791.1 hypothetical protein EGJ58_22065 [Brucella anthropi]
MDEIHVSIDADKWEYGRGKDGRLNTIRLKSFYSYIEWFSREDFEIFLAIIHDNIEPDHLGLSNYLIRGNFFFFQSKEDRDLVQTIRLLY